MIKNNFRSSLIQKVWRVVAILLYKLRFFSISVLENAFFDCKGPKSGKKYKTRYVEEGHDDFCCFIYYSRFVAPLIRKTRFSRSDTLKKSEVSTRGQMSMFF